MGMLLEGQLTELPNFTRWQVIAFFLAAFGLVFLAPLFVVGWHGDILVPRSGDLGQAKVQLWAISIALQAVFWLYCLIYLNYNWKQLNASRHFAKAWHDAAWICIVPAAVLVGYISVTIRHQSSLPPLSIGSYPITNLRFFGSTGVLIVGIALWQMFVTRSLFLLHWTGLTNSEEKIACLLEFRRKYTWLLFIASLVLALGTLASAAMAAAANAFDTGIFPGEYPVGYGAWYSLLLLIMYFPVQGSYVSLVRSLISDLLGAPPKQVEDLKKWSENSTKLEGIFGIDVSKSSMLGPLLSTLLPLISGWISKLVTQ